MTVVWQNLPRNAVSERFYVCYPFIRNWMLLEIIITFEARGSLIPHAFNA